MDCTKSKVFFLLRGSDKCFAFSIVRESIFINLIFSLSLLRILYQRNFHLSIHFTYESLKQSINNFTKAEPLLNSAFAYSAFVKLALIKTVGQHLSSLVLYLVTVIGDDSDPSTPETVTVTGFPPAGRTEDSQINFLRFHFIGP